MLKFEWTEICYIYYIHYTFQSEEKVDSRGVAKIDVDKNWLKRCV